MPVTDVKTDRALRDPCVGTTGATLHEEHFYFGPAGARLYGSLFIPGTTTARAPVGIVLCPPFAHEHGFAFRLTVEWGRALAQQGAIVLRFDYRGHGDSAGAFEDQGVDDLLADVRGAIAALQDRAGVPCHGLCGLRLGATLAALAAAADATRRALILCEPIVNGERHFDELLRVVLAKDLAGGRPPQRTRAELKQAILRGEPVPLEGYLLTERWYRSLAAIDLLRAPGVPEAGPALIVQVNGRRAAPPRPDLVALQAAYARHGQSELRTVSAPSLWYGTLTSEYAARVRPQGFFDDVLAWTTARGLTAPLGYPGASPDRAPIEPGRAPLPVLDLETEAYREQAVTFPTDTERLRGTLIGPAGGQRCAPLVLLLPQGMNPRAGWNRLYVKVARALAAEGWTTLRFDARGLGNSTGRLDLVTGVDVFRAIESGSHVPDTLAALDFTQQFLGPTPVILAGVCGGAVTAGLVAAGEPRVAGAAILEVPLVYTTPVQVAEPLWRYRDKLLSLRSWGRLLTFRADYRQHLRSIGAALRRRWAGNGVDADTRWLMKKLGPAANLELMASFRRCLHRRIPLLYVFGSTDNAACFARVRPQLAASAPGYADCVTEHTVTGADHDFLEPAHTDELIRILAAWLRNPQQPWSESPAG